MRKLSGATTLALLLVLVLGSTVAYATWHWCPDDPILDIGGHEVHVNTVVTFEDGQDQDLVKGPIHVKVYVPRDVETEVTDDGGFQVTIIPNGQPVGDGPIPVKVKALVNTKGPERVPVTLEVWEEPDVFELSTEGESKTWIECEFELD